MDTGSSLPDIVLNTHPSEPTIPSPVVVEAEESPVPARPKKLVRRAASRASSRAPSEPLGQVDMPKAADNGPSDLSAAAQGDNANDESSVPPRKVCIFACQASQYVHTPVATRTTCWYYETYYSWH